jgi:hypothetical protein
MLKYQNYIEATKIFRKTEYSYNNHINGNYDTRNMNGFDSQDIINSREDATKAENYFNSGEAYKLCEYYSKAGEMYEKSSIYEDNIHKKFKCVKEAVECYRLSYGNDYHKIKPLSDIHLDYSIHNLFIS